MRERARLAQLPDLAEAVLSLPEWASRTEAAGLAAVFDTDGRVSPSSDDETYDMVEEVMRAEGRHEEAARFVATRPARRRGPPPTWNGAPPDPLRRGTWARTFGLHMQRTETGLQLQEVCARMADTDRWARLLLHGTERSIVGCWSEVPEAHFNALMQAVQQIFGALPTLASTEPKEHWRIASGTCSCGRRGALLLHTAVWTTPKHTLATTSACLLCAHRDVPAELAEAVRNHRGPLDDLTKIRRLAPQPSLVRCTACSTPIKRGAWALSGVFVEGALHLECAVTAEPEGFRAALEGTEFGEAEAWRARLG